MHRIIDGSDGSHYERSAELPAEPAAHGTTRPRGARFRGWRGWLLRVGLCVGAPLLVVAVLEAGLRCVGYGYPTSFLIGPDARGDYRVNYQFGWRFFPRALARQPGPILLTPKPAGTVRIVILGESAAKGIPAPAFGFGRILHVMLREQFPDTRFEVINAAMTAINSHVVVEVARELARHDVDIFVAYMGHNEVTGPYGPGSVFQQWSRRRQLIRASMWAKSLRVGQALDSLAAWWHRDESPDSWRGIEMCLEQKVAADDPQLTQVYENWRENLDELCDIARDAGATLVISNVCVNLRDFPPLASLHRRDVSRPALDRWDALYQEGVVAESAGEMARAIERYEAAAQIDPQYAELVFRLGRCLLKQGRVAEAREQFLQACELDALRFRADSRINELIRTVTAHREAERIWFVDAQAAIAASELVADGIPGDELFYDHVHMNFDGNYRLAHAIGERLPLAFPDAVQSQRAADVPSQTLCAQRLAFTRWHEFNIHYPLASMISRPPFVDQLDHAVRRDALHLRIRELHTAITAPGAMEEAVRCCRDAIDRWPDSWELHEHLAMLLEEQGNVPEAIDRWREVIRLVPVNLDAVHHLATLLATSPTASVRDGAEAVKLAEQAVMLAGSQEPKLLDTLAAAYAQAGRFSDAIATAERAMKLAQRERNTSLADTVRARLRHYRAEASVPCGDVSR